VSPFLTGSMKYPEYNNIRMETHGWVLPNVHVFKQSTST